MGLQYRKQTSFFRASGIVLAALLVAVWTPSIAI